MMESWTGRVARRPGQRRCVCLYTLMHILVHILIEFFELLRCVDYSCH